MEEETVVALLNRTKLPPRMATPPATPKIRRWRSFWNSLLMVDFFVSFMVEAPFNKFRYVQIDEFRQSKTLPSA
jgi:hypothetical protein